MKQKIEWYREVLELEPGSRVFFPLAKLLAADGQLLEAVSTLQQGVLRHPDHVESRLLLVELLFLQDKREDAQTQIQNLGTMFKRYPGFWRAWSDDLARLPATTGSTTAYARPGQRQWLEYRYLERVLAKDERTPWAACTRPGRQPVGAVLPHHRAQWRAASGPAGGPQPATDDRPGPVRA